MQRDGPAPAALAAADQQGAGRDSYVPPFLGDGFSGHSGRIGMALRMGAVGAPKAAVQHQGRWKHGDVVARYTWGEPEKLLSG